MKEIAATVFATLAFLLLAEIGPKTMVSSFAMAALICSGFAICLIACRVFEQR